MVEDSNSKVDPKILKLRLCCCRMKNQLMSQSNNKSAIKTIKPDYKEPILMEPLLKKTKRKKKQKNKTKNIYIKNQIINSNTMFFFLKWKSFHLVKTFSPLPVCALKYLVFKKKKQWVNPIFENECELKRFKVCAMYPRVKSFWI